MEENKITTKKVFGFLGKAVVVVTTGTVMLGASPFGNNVNKAITTYAGEAIKTIERWEKE